MTHAQSRSSRVYYDALQAHLSDPAGNGRVLYSSPVAAVTRLDNDPRGKVQLTTEDGETAFYDAVVFAYVPRAKRLTANEIV